MTTSLTILAAEEGGGQSNFLIPNGTFFVVLIIFLIVLGVIAKWVVPPIIEGAARARSDGAQDDRGQSARRTMRAAADADYLKVMAYAPVARRRTSAKRPAPKGARSSTTRKARANAEVSSVLQQATEELTEQSRAVDGRASDVGRRRWRRSLRAACSASR